MVRENGVDDEVGVGLVERSVSEEQPMVDGSEDHVCEVVEVQGPGQLTLFTSELEALEGVCSPRPKVSLEEVGAQSRVVLGFADQRAEVGPEALVGIELDDLGEAGAHVGHHVAGVGGRHSGGDAFEGVEHDGRLRRPPPVDGLLADAGAGRDGFHADFGVSPFPAQR